MKHQAWDSHVNQYVNVMVGLADARTTSASVIAALENIFAGNTFREGKKGVGNVFYNSLLKKSGQGC